VVAYVDLLQAADTSGEIVEASGYSSDAKAEILWRNKTAAQ